MDRSSSASAELSTAIWRNSPHHRATDCTSIHVACARAIWPHKTAENWALAAKRKVRAAKYWLATGDVSEAGKLAILRLLT